MSKENKDIWDIISIISSLLIPMSIGIGSYIVSKSQAESDIKSKEQEIVIAKINAKVEQAALVSTFLEALVDSNSYKRQLAVKSILLALPEEGSDIVLTISEYDPDEEVKTFAKKTLEESSAPNNDNQNPYSSTNIDELIDMIYSEDKGVRLKATNNIVNNWLYEPNLIKKLISNSRDKMGESTSEKAGLINTIFILNKFDVKTLKLYTTELNDFITEVNKIKGRATTSKMINELSNKL